MPHQFFYAFDDVTRAMWDADALQLVEVLYRAGFEDLAKRIERHPYMSTTDVLPFDRADLEQLCAALRSVAPESAGLKELKRMLEQMRDDGKLVC